jgi:predicted transcriptional regulator
LQRIITIIATRSTCWRKKGGKFAMARRCRLNIIIEILDAASSGATKTKIVYETNLNFAIATKYLDLLQEKKLIRKNGNFYEITGEGQMFLKKAKELQI